MSRRSYYSEARRRARRVTHGDGIGRLRPEQLAALRELNLAEQDRLAKKYAEPAPSTPAPTGDPEDGEGEGQ